MSQLDRRAVHILPFLYTTACSVCVLREWRFVSLTCSIFTCLYFLCNSRKILCRLLYSYNEAASSDQIRAALITVNQQADPTTHSPIYIQYSFLLSLHFHRLSTNVQHRVSLQGQQLYQKGHHPKKLSDRFSLLVASLISRSTCSGTSRAECCTVWWGTPRAEATWL